MNSHEFDAYAPLAQSVLGLLAGLAVLDRAVRLKGSFGSAPIARYSDFIKRAENVALSRSVRVQGQARRISDYFRKPMQEPVALGGRSANSATVMAGIEALIRELVTKDFYANGSALSLAKSDNPVQEFGKLRELAEKMWHFSEEHYFQKIYKRCNPTNARPATLEQFIKTAFGDSGGAKHPTFPSLDIFDASALKAEFHQLYDAPQERADPSCGLFAVIRESRGFMAPPGDAHKLVRELLWLMPEKKREEDFFGFYISAVDRDVFIVENCLPENNTIVLNGTSRGDRTQRFTLILEAFQQRHQLQFGHGVMAGLAAQHRSQPSRAGGRRASRQPPLADAPANKPSVGAWRVLVIRPSWDIGLDRILYDCRREQTAKVRGVVSDVHAVGVLSGEKSICDDRRQAFHRLIANERHLRSRATEKLADFLFSEFEKQLDKTNGATLSRAKAGKGNELRSIIRQLAGIIEEHWHLVEPAQVVNFGRIEHSEHEVDIRTLLERDEGIVPELNA